MSDLISRQAAIDALKNDMASLDHIIKGMSANDVRLDVYVSQRNQVNYDIYTINNLPPALGTNLAEVGTDCISRQAAIDALKQQAEAMSEWSNRYAEQRKGVLTAVNIVEDLPPVRPEQLGTNLAEVGTDCISREQAIDALDKRFDSIPIEQTTEILLLRKDLRDLPPAQPERIKGLWISADAIFGGEPFYCSECGENTRDTVMGKPRWNFYPNYGVDMRGEQDD